MTATMKKRYAAILISAMIMLGAISGYLFHILFFKTIDNLLHSKLSRLGFFYNELIY